RATMSISVLPSIDIIPDTLMKSPSTALTVLTSMITPALLLSACGTFILSTSQRLGRVIDRVRALTEMMESTVHDEARLELVPERRTAIFDMLDRQSRRAKLLANALMIFYVAASAFVATSVAIGVVSIYNPRDAWIPLACGIIGAFLLFIGSLIMMVEARLAVASLRSESAFVNRLVEHHYRQQVSGV
ncbi:MAG TPA: DUF2721 domain-containing protein, partial [Bryobacteraceae bacterium]|nr:DUF2721 domain-containing protein [Bryobacteraceae bacterium]